MYTKLRHESRYLQNTTFWQNYIRNKKKKKPQVNFIEMVQYNLLNTCYGRVRTPTPVFQKTHTRVSGKICLLFFGQ